MVLPTLLVLSAAPVHLFVYSGEDPGNAPAQLVKKYDAGSKLVDVSGVYELFHTGILFEDFDAFTRAPPPGWPDALAPQWKEAMGFCRGTVGPPPWVGPAANTALTCSRRITDYLWQKYFELQHAERVYFVTSFKDEKKGTAQVTARTFTPNETVEHVTVLNGGYGDLGALVSEAIASMAKPDSMKQRQPRVVEAALPALDPAQKAKADAAPDPFVAQVASKEPVKLAKECDALPSALTVTPGSTLGSALEARWKASVKSKAPAAACTLELATHEEQGGMMGPMKVVTATLKCGAASASAEAPGAGGMSRNKPVDLMAERLITGLAKALCR